MICGCLWNGEFDKGREVFSNEGFELNEFSLTGVISGLFDVKEGKQIHGIGLKMGFLCGGSIHFNNAVMSRYSRCGSKVEAVKMFDEITDPDIVSWTERERDVMFREDNPSNLSKGRVFVGNALICMYGKCGKMDGASTDESRRVFSDIDKISVMHLNAMLSTLIWNREEGFTPWLLNLDLIMIALIDLYCKRGSIDNLAAWNAMITGYAQHGCYYEAFELYDRMTECRIEPDEITYLGLLTSYCHAGTPGRGKEDIDQMPIKPDARIWQILLSACSIHINVDMGRIAAIKLLELQLDNDLPIFFFQISVLQLVLLLRESLVKIVLCWGVRSYASGTPANCTSLNISHLVVHDAGLGRPLVMSYCCVIAYRSSHLAIICLLDPASHVKQLILQAEYHIREREHNNNNDESDEVIALLGIHISHPHPFLFISEFVFKLPCSGKCMKQDKYVKAVNFSDPPFGEFDDFQIPRDYSSFS
ncbi:hypothetical protein CRYUN_Cryun07bG0151200 [Craigia yunnanensis]